MQIRRYLHLLLFVRVQQALDVGRVGVAVVGGTAYYVWRASNGKHYAADASGNISNGDSSPTPLIPSTVEVDIDSGVCSSSPRYSSHRCPSGQRGAAVGNSSKLLDTTLPLLIATMIALGKAALRFALP